MENSNVEWLPHLESSIPEVAYGYTISMYSVALEGWRRGLKLRFENKNRPKAHTEFYLGDKEKEHRFIVSRGDKVPNSTIKICIDKNKTKEYLLAAEVPTPIGRAFKGTDIITEIKEYAFGIGFPVVIKPIDGTGGHGVIANIKNASELDEAISYVKKDLNVNDIIIESHFTGIDCRLYVINGEVIGAFKRIPANVIGDGKSSITELIEEKQQLRFKNPSQYGNSYKIDNEVFSMLKRQGYSMDSVLENGKRVYFKSKNNMSSGGDSIDMTDKISNDIKQIAIDAVKAIPGLVQAGVDMMINEETGKGEVIEINTRPSIRTHLFPMEGQARDIPRAIIDYYFPNTKENNSKPLLYFDFAAVWKGFRLGRIKEFTIPNYPKYKIESTRFLIDTKTIAEDFDQWIMELARGLKLNGYIKFLNENKIAIIVAGEKRNISFFRSIITSDLTGKISEKQRTSPVKLGFERNFDESYNLKIRKGKLDKKGKERLSKNLSKKYAPINLQDI